MQLIRFAITTALASASLLLAIAFTGCAAPNTDPEPGMRDPALPYSRIIINDDELARGLRFDEPLVVRNEDGFIIRVEVTARALSSNTLKVDYRPIFKDSVGLVIQPESSWRTTFLEARVPERIAMIPNGSSAVDYEIQFRWAR